MLISNTMPAKGYNMTANVSITLLLHIHINKREILFYINFVLGITF